MCWDNKKIWDMLGSWQAEDVSKYRIYEMCSVTEFVKAVVGSCNAYVLQCWNIWDILEWCKVLDVLQCCNMTNWDAGMYEVFWDFGMWDLLKCKRCVGMLESRRHILMRECMRLAGILKCENYRRDVFEYWNL